jgi:hypothetical protein
MMGAGKTGGSMSMMGGGPGPSPTPGGSTAAAPGGIKPKPRYEFVAFILWKEPTPTDPTPGAGGP